MELTFHDRKAIQLARWLRENCKKCPICDAFSCGDSDHVSWHQDQATKFQNAKDRLDTADAALDSAQTKFVQQKNRMDGLEARIVALEAKVP